jgi:hypothetical protein
LTDVNVFHLRLQWLLPCGTAAGAPASSTRIFVPLMLFLRLISTLLLLSHNSSQSTHAESRHVSGHRRGWFGVYVAALHKVTDAQHSSERFCMVLNVLDVFIYSAHSIITSPHFILDFLSLKLEKKTPHAIVQPSIAGHKSHVADHGRRLRPALAGAESSSCYVSS